MKVDEEIVEVAAYSELDRGNILEEVTFSQRVRSVLRSSFKMCKRLRKITFEEGIECIGEAAFFGCESLEKIKFPKSLKEIGSEAFRLCKALKEVEISDELLLAIPENVFVQCPCEESLSAKRNELKERQHEKEERDRVLQYEGFFKGLFEAVMKGDNLTYPKNYREMCQEFTKVDNIADDGKLRRLYYVEDNHVASVGRGCMDIQFANYNEHHPESSCPLTWETIDRNCLVDIALTIRDFQEINESTLEELQRLWSDFKRVVGGLNLRQVFARMVATLCPNLVVPVVHPEAMNELYTWFEHNGFTREDTHMGNGWLRRWIIQNSVIKRFLTTCLCRNKYEIGPFVWYFVEAFRQGDLVRHVVVERQEMIRGLISESGYSFPARWSDNDENL